MEDIMLSVIIPVYNEVNTILEIIKWVQNEEHRKEIIIVDDASTDGTKELLEEIKGENIKVLFNEENRGKGYCIRRALDYVSGDIVIIQDADLEYYPDEYGILIEKIIEGKADAVYGSRFLGTHRVFYFYHYLGNLVLNLIANIVLNTNLTDLMSCYKAFRTPVIRKLQLEADRFGIEIEITAELFKRRYRVYEVPISYSGRSYDEGKKIKWTDFFVCLYWLLKASLRRMDIGEDILLKTMLMRNNNRWIYNKLKPFIGKKVIELGAGIGTISKFLISREREVTLVDIEYDHICYLKRRFVSNPRVKIHQLDIENAGNFFSPCSCDTIIGINIIEHIEKDKDLMADLWKLIDYGGRLILTAPAHKALFSKFDRTVGHFRRYSKEELEDKLCKSGFHIEKIEFMNSLGALFWFLKFKLLKGEYISNISACIFDRLVPLISFIERWIRFNFGLYLFCVAKKPFRGEE